MERFTGVDVFAGLRVMQATIFRLDIDTWRQVYQRLECQDCKDVIKASVTGGVLEIWFPEQHAAHVLATINEHDWIHNNWDKEHGIV